MAKKILSLYFWSYIDPKCTPTSCPRRRSIAPKEFADFTYTGDQVELNLASMAHLHERFEQPLQLMSSVDERQSTRCSWTDQPLVTDAASLKEEIVFRGIAILQSRLWTSIRWHASSLGVVQILPKKIKCEFLNRDDDT